MHTTEPPPTPPMDESIDAPKRQRRFAGVNDIMMRCTITAFTFLVSLAGFCYFSLGLVYYYSQDWPLLRIAGIVLLAIGLTFLLNRFTWKRHAILETKERSFSMLAGAYWGYILALLYLFIFPHNDLYIVSFFILLPFIGICMGMKIPIYGCPALWDRLIIVAILCVIAILPLWFIAMHCRRDVSYQAEHFPRGLSSILYHDYAMITENRIPHGVTDIDLKGEFFGFWGDRYNWSCRLPEADFIAFVEEHNYHLADEKSDNQIEKNIGRLRTLHGIMPTHYWAYGQSHHFLLLYDRTTGILHGSYSNNPL